MAGESSALGLLCTYESSSDSERDSGYTSDEDKKRKCDRSLSEDTHKIKRQRTDNNSMVEDMIVDSTNISVNKQSSLNNCCSNKSQDKSVDLHIKRNCIVIPLPNELTLAGPSHVDEGSKHQGRARTFPHDPGNWASIFYFPLNEITSAGQGMSSFSTLQNLVCSIRKCCKLHGLHLTASTDFHISLSKTLLLRLHMIQPLTQHVRATLTTMPSFTVWLNKFAVYVNEEATRTFLGLDVLAGHAELATIVGKLDHVLDTYQLPSFYKECSLHASVAWVKGDQRQLLNSLLPLLEEEFSSYFTYNDDLRAFNVLYLNFKAGNRIHKLQLGRYTT
uniref:U6 snRNA phosphodiesterase 1 n=1 Tax=Hirondellea gigas TaxID=1518452 RepID=A0A2P2HWU2_9CRUS